MKFSRLLYLAEIVTMNLIVGIHNNSNVMYILIGEYHHKSLCCIEFVEEI